MFRNYLTIALRNLWKERLFSLISIGGLAIGLAASIIIIQFVWHEWSFDTFHENQANIYRIVTQKGTSTFAGSSSKLAAQIAGEGSGIKDYTRIHREFSVAIKNPDKPALINNESGFVFADPTLFSIFTFPLLYGNAASALQNPFSVVISEKMAKKYFGSDNPIGKKISYNGEYLFKVTGVVKNVPTNSTISFDFVASNDTYQKINSFAFDYLPNFETFLLLKGTNAIPQLLRNIKAANKLVAPLSYKEHDQYELEPLTQLRLGNSYTYNEKPGAKQLVILSVIAALILILALFNYTNLTTARATLRAKEVGVRKAIGATRLSLVKQFLLEAMLVTFWAFLIGILLVILLRQPFNDLFGYAIDSSFLLGKTFLGLLVCLFMGVSLIAGFYPALILSGFSPLKVIKGNYISQSQGAKVRSGVIVFQFGISAMLIIASLVMQQQVRFLKAYDLGFNREQLVTITLSDTIAQKSENVRKAVMNQAGLNQVSLSNASFFGAFGELKFTIGPSGKQVAYSILQADADFVQNLGVSWLVKPSTHATYNDDGFQIMLNESAVRNTGYTKASIMGQTIFSEQGKQYGQVVGVVKDFAFTGPQFAIKPLLFLIKDRSLPANGFRYMQIRFHPQDRISDKLNQVKQILYNYDAESPFQYSFLDDAFQKAFVAQSRIAYLVEVFTVVAIVLSCLGLFGLITFMGQTRAKEISIRKVMGASVANIISLLSQTILFLVLLAFLVAIPGAYFLMTLWLQEFAYRIELSWWLFVLGGVLVVGITVLTISYQWLTIARANPIHALRAE